MSQPNYWSCSCCGRMYRHGEDWLWDEEHPLRFDWVARLCFVVIAFATIYLGAHLLVALSNGALTDKEAPPCQYGEVCANN